MRKLFAKALLFCFGRFMGCPHPEWVYNSYNVEGYHIQMHLAAGRRNVTIKRQQALSAHLTRLDELKQEILAAVRNGYRVDGILAYVTARGYHQTTLHARLDVSTDCIMSVEAAEALLAVLCDVDADTETLQANLQALIPSTDPS